ncbi:DUF7410 domain-containing protein [Natronobiforma cellulositropha]|uniref:DUF7410 domain-containing protein n=1 Tax=Natronobiforma cellulositropha TaxID=1679076 RepID=UPI0021D59145|nr:hypothetical protein [Natronobiforma cellulositropha]
MSNSLPTQPETYAESIIHEEYDVPPGEDPVATCPYCERPFTSEQLATVHIGVRHTDVCSEAEREAYEEELEAAEHDLFTFHAKAAVSIFLIYFMFSFIYSLAWID